MTSDASSSQSRRRAGVRAVNYSEKDADAELVRRIDQFEKVSKQSKTRSTPGETRACKVTNAKSGSPGSRRHTTSPKNKYQKFLSEKSVKWNLIPSLPPTFRKSSRFSNILDLKDATVNVTENSLRNLEGVLLKANETIYMVSEPPGEPYYIGRVVEFVAKSEFIPLIEELKKFTSEFAAHFFQVRMNWFYRPRDIQENIVNFDPRLIYASLHQDVCPIISYRGKCTVLPADRLAKDPIAKAEILTRPNIFYFEQLFDRYSLTYYNVRSTVSLLELDKSSPFLYALSKRYKHIFLEEKFPLEALLRKYTINQDSNAELDTKNDWDKRCTVCREWCSSQQSLKCDECRASVHLFCMDPPLERKPNKGVIWLCFNCLKCQEGTKEALKELRQEQDKQEREIFSEKANLNSLAENMIKKGIQLEEAHSFQYMGEHMICHLGDLLVNKFCIPYPFKNSRVGLKYQWSGCADSEEWTPKPYSSVEEDFGRGSKATSEILWLMDDSRITDTNLNSYIENCKEQYPAKLDIVSESCNFLDMIVKTLMDHNYNTEMAFTDCGRLLSRESLKEPTFSQEEIEMFESSVAQHGSELHLVCKDVATQSMSMIVRYYYHWKKTPNGRKIWGSFKGRPKNRGKSKPEDNIVDKKHPATKSSRERKPTKLALENHNGIVKEELKFMDDSCFDTENMASVKTCFKCVFCEIDYSPLWYKVTGGCDDEHLKHRIQRGVNERSEKSLDHSKPGKPLDKLLKVENDRLDALCIRCARLWRRYGTRWQTALNVFKKLNGSSMQALTSCLDNIFEEQNPSMLIAKPEQARNKLVEWELIIDAELIAHQRLDLVNHPEIAAKMKASTLASRSALYKLTKKPYNRDHFNGVLCKNELERMLQKFTRKKQKTVRLPTKPTIEMPMIVHEKRSENGQQTNGGRQKKSLIPKVLDVTHYDLDLIENGDIKVKVPLSAGKCGILTVDDDFENITIDDAILAQLLSSTKRKRNFCLEVEDPLASKRYQKLRKSGEYGSYTNSQHLTAPPIIVPDNCTAAMLKAFYASNRSLRSIVIEKTQTADKKERIGDNSNSEFCAVCRGKLDERRNEKLNCNNCGTAVHYFCYGVDVSNSKSSNNQLEKFKWLCDPCSNDLNPLVSTHYQCILCRSKNRDNDSTRGSHNGTYGGALKCTTSGSWAHMACALFNKNIGLGQTCSLQPILNTRLVLIRNSCQSCEICHSEGGGLINCELCRRKFHVTCAQNNRFFSFMFKKASMAPQDRALHETEFVATIGKKAYVISGPFLLCDIHTDDAQAFKEGYFSLNGTFDDMGRPLMQIFANKRQGRSRRSMVYERFLEQNCLEEDITGPGNIDEGCGQRATSAKAQNEEPHNEAFCRYRRFQGIKQMFKALEEVETKIDIANNEVNVENCLSVDDLLNFENDSLDGAERPLSELEIQSLLKDINPECFDIKISKGDKEKKKRKPKTATKKVTNTGK